MQKFKLNFSKQYSGFPLQIIFWWLQAMLLNNYIIKISEDKCRYFKCNFDEKKISEDKCRYFKCNFDEKNNYAYNFEEKACSVLL